MAERIVQASCALLILVLMNSTPWTHAQSFQEPDLDFPGYMDEGSTNSISCYSISTGINTTLVMVRSDGENVNAPTSCKSVGGGTYMCIATYTFTVKQADIGVRLTCTANPTDSSIPSKSSPPGVFNQVRVPPTLVPVISGPNSVKAGENNTWTCTSQPVLPAGQLRWRIGTTNVYTDGTNPDPTPSGQLFVSTSSISQIFTSSDGVVDIHCDLSHVALDQKLTQTKRVTVEYVPVVTSTTTTYTPQEGLSQELMCSIDAVPSPTDVHWLKDNQQLNRVSGKYLNGNSDSNPALTIVNIQKEDSGLFVCTATNSVGTSTGPNITVTVRYSPKVTTPENTYNADLYSSLVIPCIIDANPAATSVTWKKTRNGVTEDLVIASSGGKYNGGSISTPALSINNLALTDGGDYQCVVANGISPEGKTPVVKVMISYPPTDISVAPVSPVVNETQAVTVACSADGVPAPTYSWYYESNPQVISSLQNLVIDPAKSSDSGRYRCIASNAKGNASITVVVSVWYKPRLTPSSSPQVADEGSTLTLECNINSNPMPFTVAWQDSQGDPVDRSSGRISGGTSFAFPDLTFTGIQIADSGFYRCRVDNAVGVSTSAFVDVKVSYPPRNIQVTPANSVHNLDEGDPLTLTCSAEAEPPATYTWKAGSAVIGTGHTLVITSAGPVDNREVTCEATNSKDTVSKSTTINVSYTPVVTIPGGDAFGVDEGQSLVLPCLVDANPADTTFNWLRDSTAVDLTDTSKYGGGTLTSRNLTIFSLASSDAGNYSCRSVNSVGTGTSREVTVTISSAPKTISFSPTTVSANEGETIEVTCSSDGTPTPNYTWLRGGTEYARGAILQINSATPGDNANFTCRATNSKGTKESVISISVLYTPRRSDSNTGYQTTIGKTVTLTCPVIANPPATSYTWSFGGASLNETGPSIDVTPTEKASFGPYTCTATNSVGTSDGIVLTLQLPTGTGESTAAASLPTPILILIILLIILLIIIIIVIVVICIKKGKCKKKDPKGRVGPAIAANAAGMDASPRPTEKPLTEAHSGLRSPQWSAVSRQHVDVTMNGHANKEHDKLSIEDESLGGAPVPNGIPGDEAMAGGTIISVPDGSTPRPHHLPPVEPTPEKKKKRKRKKKHREETGEKPIDAPIEEQEEEEEEE